MILLFQKKTREIARQEEINGKEKENHQSLAADIASTVEETAKV